jgi:thiosulfate dehydrogenase [quinone] large subunit
MDGRGVLSRIKPSYLIVAVIAFAGFWLFRVGTNSEEFSAGAQFLALIVGLVLFVVAAIVLFRDYRAEPDDVAEVRNPGFAHFLFNSARSAPLWLGARIYLGYEWFVAGQHKVTDPAWMDGGAALQGYWERAVAVPEGGRAPITYGFFREYIQYMLGNEWYTWFAPVIVWGELLVGIGLILGALTGIAAFFGALMNMSFMLAGSASTNPILFTLSILIILAWRVAGLIGLDRWLLPALGAPWSPGSLLRRQTGTDTGTGSGTAAPVAGD